MAYTAIEKMRRINQERFGKDTGPIQPYLTRKSENGCDLVSASLRFLHERCEGLRLSPEREREEAETGKYTGTSLRQGQIPYNMQMDLDRLCLERELEKFFETGTAEDAYTVYYAYLEMFLGRYANSNQMIELLSEFESNASSLLMKHRDHYSHSVYVFALGLAFYESNARFRETYQAFYGFSFTREHEAAAHFLEYWGLTSLFHDIGYPFEIPFEQVLAYFEMDRKDRGEGSPHMVYRGLDSLTGLDPEARARFRALFGRAFASTDGLLAYGLRERLGSDYPVTEDGLRETLKKKPTDPAAFNYYMDHAYFSAVRLYQELREVLGADGLRAEHLDVLTAIVLHNSLFKFSIAFYRSEKDRQAPLRAKTHPLAYLLMLCDELQSWDRTAYGRNSRTELHPMAADFDFGNGGIRVRYIFDEAESDKIRAYEADLLAWSENGKQGEAPRLKAYSAMAGEDAPFGREIERIVDLSECPLTVAAELRAVDRRSKHVYLSASSFLHLYDFAVALNGRYSYEGRENEVSTEELEREFDAMSLEYKLSNINQAKSFSAYLNAIGCFYTDRQVGYPMVRRFTPEEVAVFSPMEHGRWVREHKRMGWIPGDAYETLPLDPDGRNERRALREQMRMHKLCMDGDPTDSEILAHYLGLSEADQDKDWKPFACMLELIRQYDGLRIYRLE